MDSSQKPSQVDVQKIRENFKRHDSNGDGTIDAKEFNLMLKRMGVLLSQSDESRLFKVMDVDGSGKIEEGELIDHYYYILLLEKKAEQKQIENLKTRTSFSAEEIQAMYANFKRIACTDKDDGLIDKLEFRTMMAETDATRNHVFYDALFRMFDRDDSGGIDFTEFVSALAIYHNKCHPRQSNPDVRSKFFFGIFDVDGDGYISRDDLTTVLRDCLAANEVPISAADIDKIVSATLGGGAKIDFNQYKALQERKG